MIKRTFIFQDGTDPYRDGEGWIGEDTPESLNDVSGLDYGLVHDLMEHQKSDTGLIEDEYKALGAMCVIRGTAWNWGTSSLNQALKGEVISLMENYNRRPLKPIKFRSHYATSMVLPELESIFNCKKKEFTEEQYKVAAWINRGAIEAVNRFNVKTFEWGATNIFIKLVDLLKEVKKYFDWMDEMECIDPKLTLIADIHNVTRSRIVLNYESWRMDDNDHEITKKHTRTFNI